MKTAANVGSVIGQFSFGRCHNCFNYAYLTHLSNIGFAADAFDRKAVCKRHITLYIYTSSTLLIRYPSKDGKELMLVIFATIMCISDPTGMSIFILPRSVPQYTIFWFVRWYPP